MKGDGRGLADEVAARVTESLWIRFEGADETASTNDDCRALAEADAPEGTVVVASRQTAGRGRLGRTWESPEGGAYFSVLLRPGVPVENVPLLALVVALGVADGLEALGTHVALKWPNDLLDAATGRKLAGILLESASEDARAAWVVAGCGINVHRPADGGFEAGAYLAETAAGDVDVAAVIAAALYGLAPAYRKWRSGSSASLLVEYDRRSVLRGRHVEVRDARGQTVASGTVAGLDPAGALLVDDGARLVAVHSGEVTLRGPEDAR